MAARDARRPFIASGLWDAAQSASFRYDHVTLAIGSLFRLSATSPPAPAPSVCGEVVLKEEEFIFKGSGKEKDALFYRSPTTSESRPTLCRGGSRRDLRHASLPVLAERAGREVFHPGEAFLSRPTPPGYRARCRREARVELIGPCVVNHVYFEFLLVPDPGGQAVQQGSPRSGRVGTLRRRSPLFLRPRGCSGPFSPAPSRSATNGRLPLAGSFAQHASNSGGRAWPLGSFLLGKGPLTQPKSPAPPTRALPSGPDGLLPTWKGPRKSPGLSLYFPVEPTAGG